MISAPHGYSWDGSIRRGFPESTGCTVSNALRPGGDVTIHSCTERRLTTGDEGRLYYQILQPRPSSGRSMMLEFTMKKKIGKY